MKKIFRVLLVIFSSFPLISCATIIDGPTQDVPLKSKPSGANVEVTKGGVEGKVIEKGKTPHTVTLPRGESIYVHFSKEGYEPKTGYLRYSVNGVYVLNIVTLNFPGLFIDAATEASDEYTHIDPLPLGSGGQMRGTGPVSGMFLVTLDEKEGREE